MVAADVTVIVDVPGFTDVIVTVEPLMLAVATLVVPDVTLNVPPLVFVLTVNVPVFGYAIVPLVALSARAFVPFAIVTATVLLDAL